MPFTKFQHNEQDEQAQKEENYPDINKKEIENTKEDKIKNSIDFNDKTASLFQSAQTLQASTEEGLSAIEELKSTMESIAAAAEESAGAAEESLGAVKIIKSNSNHILEASQVSIESMEKLEDSILVTAEKINDSSDNMLRIAKTAENVYTVGERLHKAGEEVSQTVTLITKLAKRTSLLALNAAIEASRAKEKGRGFSVISKEIRSLSAKSNNYAKEINTTVDLLQANVQKIREIIIATKDSIENSSNNAIQNAKNMQELIQVLIEMTKKVKNSLTRLKDLDNIITKIQLSSESIASAAEESASAVSEVTQTISMQVTAFEQSNSAAKLLEKMAEKLQNNTTGNNTEQAINEIASAAEELSSAIEEIVNSTKQSVISLSQIKEAAAISKEDANTNTNLTSSANEIAHIVKEEVDIIKEQILHIKKEFKLSAKTIQNAGNDSKDNLRQTQEVLDKAKEMKQSIKHLKKILRKIELTNVQTASLSINGSVEGMQLKDEAENYAEGFLAVSNDIRNLAQNSEESLDKINNIIDNLEDETENIIEALHAMQTQGIIEADAIIALSEVMDKNTINIDQNIQTFDNISNKINEIASALEEAQTGASQTQTAAELTQKNVQESEIAAEHIQSISNVMADNISELIEISAIIKDA